MAFSSIGNQNLGKFLQIYFSAGVRNQISEDYRDWEFVKSVREMDPNGRQTNFFFQTGYGPSAIQYRNPNGSTNFPTKQQISTAEYTALYKELDATIEIEYNLWKSAQHSPAKYAEPLAMELQSKSTAAKRRLASDLYGDGTGVLGTSTGAATLSGSDVEFTISSTNAARGFVGNFEYGEILELLEEDATASAIQINTNVTPDYWQVISKDRANDKVVLRPLNSSLNAITATSVDTQPTAGDVFYKYEQPTKPDLTSISDYGSASEVIAGLESLVASDGRTIHGIPMIGATAGSTYNAGGNPFDSSHVQRALSNTKTRVGETYAHKMLVMAHEVNDALIESRETDRRFQTIEDNKRGLKKFAYVHGNDTLEVYTSEFCPKTRVYILPEAKAGSKVLEAHMTDFEAVRAKDGDEFMMKPASGGGHQRSMVSYMTARGTIICKHPAAITRIENFTV